eukprot:CAMPEP_0117665868 /NCGR_PEP_ID=MMETSP0804-20121206/10050_1 /TAXON_ID=1074897 /ORGANISM="Tetraselmis astigmatica, Strain CCMP880" /LENGTH=318 /DNA_ID=CAMNT_0005473331 /DNA_START=783 /DNA_END=1736 /DNA_ORIENTATION=-
MTAALLHDSLGEPVRVRVGSCGGAGSYESSQAAVPEFGGHSSFCQTMLATDKIFQCCPGNLKLQGSVVDVAVTAVPCAMDVGSVPSTETSSWAGPSAEDAAGLPRKVVSLMEMRSTTSSFDLDEPFVCQADKATGSVCDGNDVQPELPSVISVTGRPGSLRIRIKVPPRHIQAAADSNRKKRPRPGTPRYSGQEDSSRPSSRSGGRRRHSSSKQNKRHCSSPDSRSDALVDRHHHVERYLDSSGEQAYQRLRAAFMNFCLVRERQAGAAWARCDYWGFEISDEAAAEHMAEYTQAVKGAGCLSPVTRRVLRRSLDAEW